MAQRRMFAKTIIDSDAFLEMPLSSQTLYFHLSMRADDEGFINNPKSIMRIVGAKDDDMKLLIAKKFIIPFESGVVVIKHWKIHNYIQNDRFTPTKYPDEKAMLTVDKNSTYQIENSQCIHNGYTMDTQVRLGKVREGKDSKEEDTKKKTSRFAPPSIDELNSYISSNNYNVNAETFINHYETVGWKVGKNKMKDWKAAVRGWHSRQDKPKQVNRDVPEYMKEKKVSDRKFEKVD